MSRSLFTLSSLLLALVSGCSKSHSSQPGIAGGWRLMSFVSTGIAPDTKDYSHEMRLLQLRPDSSYAKVVQGTFTQSGSYSISTRTAVNGLDTLISFKHANNQEDKCLFSLHGQQMYLNTGGGIETYQKQ